MSQSVLIVDDDQDLTLVLAGLLGQAGFSTHAVHSGTAALGALAVGRVDLVLSDLRMPGMSGLELLAALANLPAPPPLVLLTAHATISLAVEAMRNGAADFVVKPFDRDELIDVIERALGKPRNPPSPGRVESGEARTSLPRMPQRFEQERQALEFQQLVKALESAGGNRTLAARALGVSRRTLYNRLRVYGLT